MTQAFRKNLNEEFNANSTPHRLPKLSALASPKSLPRKRESPSSAKRRALLEEWRSKRQMKSATKKLPISDIFSPPPPMTPSVIPPPHAIDTPTFVSSLRNKNEQHPKKTLYVGSACKVCNNLTPEGNRNDDSFTTVSCSTVPTNEKRTFVSAQKHPRTHRTNDNAFHFSDIDQKDELFSPMAKDPTNDTTIDAAAGPSTLTKKAKSILESISNMAAKRSTTSNIGIRRSKQKTTKSTNTKDLRVALQNLSINQQNQILPKVNTSKMRNHTKSRRTTAPCNSNNTASDGNSKGESEKPRSPIELANRKILKMSALISERRTIVNAEKEKFGMNFESKNEQTDTAISDDAIEQADGNETEGLKNVVSLDYEDPIKADGGKKVDNSTKSVGNQSKSPSPIKLAKRRFEKMSTEMAQRREAINSEKDKHSNLFTTEDSSLNSQKVDNKTIIHTIHAEDKSINDDAPIFMEKEKEATSYDHKITEKTICKGSDTNTSKTLSPVKLAEEKMKKMNARMATRRKAIDAEKSKIAKFEKDQDSADNKLHIIPNTESDKKSNSLNVNAKNTPINRFPSLPLSPIADTSMLENRDKIDAVSFDDHVEEEKSEQPKKCVEFIEVEEVSESESQNSKNEKSNTLIDTLDSNSFSLHRLKLAIDHLNSQEIPTEEALNECCFCIRHFTPIVEKKSGLASVSSIGNDSADFRQMIKLLSYALTVVSEKALVLTKSYRVCKELNLLLRKENQILSKHISSSDEKSMRVKVSNTYTPQSIKTPDERRSLDLLAKEYGKLATDSNGVNTPATSSNTNNFLKTNQPYMSSDIYNVHDYKSFPTVPQTLGTAFVVELCGQLNLELGHHALLSAIMDRQWDQTKTENVTNNLSQK